MELSEVREILQQYAKTGTVPSDNGERVEEEEEEEEEHEKEEMVVERELEPEESVHEIFEKVFALNGKMGQKSLVKKLWISHETILEECSVNIMRKAFWFPEFSSCAEGVKLLASFIQKIGPQTTCRLLQKIVSEKSLSNTKCQNYGDAILTSWKWAEKDKNVVLRLEIEEELITKIAFLSIFLPVEHASKFQQMLVPFSKAKKTKERLDVAVSSCLLTTLFRGVNARNNMIRYNAASVFFMFYPLVETNEEDNFNTLEEQYKTMLSLLLDDCQAIRAEAVSKILEILGNFWALMPKPIVKQLMTGIIDKLSKDECVAVRLAVFEGMPSMLDAPACINAVTHALKCILPQGVVDRSDKVRIASLQLLYRLKRHRFINIFDIVSRQEIFCGLENESIEAVRKQFIPLIHTMLPIDDNISEEFYHPPVKYLIDKSRIAALTYYRLIAPMNLLSVHSAAEIIRMFVVWAYRVFRTSKKEVDEGKKLEDGSSEWVRGKVYIECAIMLYLSIRTSLKTPENVKYKTSIESVGLKLLTEIFNNYKETTLIGTAMVLGSLLPKDSLRCISSEVVTMLDADEIEDCLIEPFLEAAANWNIDFVFSTINKGLDIFNQTLTSLKSPTRKKSKKSDKCISPSQRLEKSLGFLKFILRSYTTNSMMANKESLTQSVMEFHYKLRLVKQAIEVRMNNPTELVIPDDLLLLALEVRMTLAPFLLNCLKANGSDDSSLTTYVSDLCTDLRWFETVIIEIYKNSSEDATTSQFFGGLANSVLSCACHSLLCWNFSDTMVEIEQEEDAENQSFCLVSFPDMLSRIILCFCSSSTPPQIMFEVFTATCQLLNTGYLDADSKLFTVLTFAPRWIANCHMVEQEAKSEGKSDWEFLDEKKASETMRSLLKACMEASSWRPDKLIAIFKVIVVILVSDATQSIENSQNIGHPREHDFEVSKLVTIFIHRFAHKVKGLVNELICSLRELITKGDLINDNVDIDEVIVRLAAVAQIVILSDQDSTGKRKNDMVDAVLSLIDTNLDNILKQREPDDNLMLSQLRALLPQPPPATANQTTD